MTDAALQNVWEAAGWLYPDTCDGFSKPCAKVTNVACDQEVSTGEDSSRKHMLIFDRDLRRRMLESRQTGEANNPYPLKKTAESFPLVRTRQVTSAFVEHILRRDQFGILDLPNA